MKHHYRVPALAALAAAVAAPLGGAVVEQIPPAATPPRALPVLRGRGTIGPSHGCRGTPPRRRRSLSRKQRVRKIRRRKWDR